jgi:DNA mismatch endonuclease, patch repair protein
MVHGCFWHRHDCGLAASPKTRPEFREAKFQANVRRDAQNKQQLEEAGWRVIVVWECKTFDETALGRWLRDEFGLESD